MTNWSVPNFWTTPQLKVYRLLAIYSYQFWNPTLKVGGQILNGGLHNIKPKVCLVMWFRLSAHSFKLLFYIPLFLSKFWKRIFCTQKPTSRDSEMPDHLQSMQRVPVSLLCLFQSFLPLVPPLRVLACKYTVLINSGDSEQPYLAHLPITTGSDISLPSHKYWTIQYIKF